MDKTNSGFITPGGRPAEKLENPSSKEVGPMDSGEGQLLLGEDLTKRSASISTARKENENKFGYYKELQKELTEKNELQKTVNQLSKEVALLRAQLDQLKNKDNIDIQTQQNFSAVEYCTDEEQLEQEITNYSRKRQSKKRKAENSPETSPQDATNLEPQMERKETGNLT